jgi:protein SCO1/2
MRLRAALGAAALAVAMLTACGGEEAEPAGIVRDPAPDMAGLSLPDASNGDSRFVFKADPGRLLVVYFGYTSCPDVCPTTLADVRSALADMGDDAQYVDLAMITVDPARDDGERLTAYVQSFVPDSHALRTDDPDELLAVAEPFGAFYEVEIADDGTVEVGHTAFLYGIDDSGLLQLQWAFGTEPEDLRSDFTLLVNRAKENRG